MAVFNILETSTVRGSVGPLQDMFTDSFQMNVLQYPEDLNSDSVDNTRKPHVIKFFINVPDNSKYIQGGATSGVTLTAGTPGVDGPPLSAQRTALGISITPVMQRLAGAISLYMPDTVNMNLDMSYEGDNLSDYPIVKFAQTGSSFVNRVQNNLPSGTGAFSGTSQEVSGALKGTGIGEQLPIDTLLKADGAAINPQIQLLFKAVSLRTFQMEFMFSPKSQAEAQTVQQIIKTFKFHAAPELAGDANSTESGLFFIVPSTFNIQFLFQGQENPFIHRIGESALESVAVDYAPNGWSTFYDGSPTQTRLTLQFKELDIIDKSKVESGY